MGHADEAPPGARTRLRLFARAMARRGRGLDPRWGNLKRAHPFSERYGFDRGLPVDRYYIEAFLQRHAPVVHGDVLEVLRPEYTNRFGAHGVRSHVIDVDADNALATIVADLCQPGSLPADSYDCVILTQTLQFLDDPAAALLNLWTSLRAGGALLVTVPCLARVDTATPERDYWRWMPRGLERILRATCRGALIEVTAGGNLVTCQSALLGLAVEDLATADFAVDDEDFPLIACGAVSKTG